MKKIIIKLLNTFICTFVLMYATFVLIEQHIKLVDFEQNKTMCIRMIQEEKMKTEELSKTKGQLKTSKYIEEVAREKLGLVMPYETVFVDASI